MDILTDSFSPVSLSDPSGIKYLQIQQKWWLAMGESLFSRSQVIVH